MPSKSPIALVTIIAAASAAGAGWYAIRAAGQGAKPAPVPPSAGGTAPDAAGKLLQVAAAARQNPRNAALAVEAGSLAGDQGQYLAALRWFQQAAAADPKLVPAITGQGQMWMELGRPGLAARKYEEALKLAPEEPQLLMELARAYTLLRDFPEAMRYALLAERKAPGDPAVHRTLAIVHTEDLRESEGMDHARKACELGPKDPENWVLLGNFQLRRQKYQDAEQSFRRALEVAPAHVAANVQFARALVDGRKTPAADREAFTYLARARTLEPRNSEALLLQSQIAARKGDTALAVSLLRQAREVAPTDSTILLALGQALVRAGKGEEGVRLVTLGQKLGPRGVPFIDLEDEARKNPQPVVTERLAELYRRRGMYDSAILVLERGLKRAPGNLALQRKLAQVSREAVLQGLPGEVHQPSTPGK